MGFKKGWREFKKAKRKRGTRKGQVRKTARRAYTRYARNPSARRNMRRKKTFNIPLVQSVAGLAIANIATKGITTSRLVDNPVATLTAAGNNLMGNKDAVIKLGLGSLLAQFVATEVLRKRTIGSIGPIKLKA